MKRLWGGLAVFVLFSSGAAVAEDKIETKVSGVIFANYDYTVSEFLSNGNPANSINSFEIGRVQVNVAAKFSDKYNAFVQLETNLITRDATANQSYLKMAYLEFNGIYPKASLRAGFVNTLWVDFENAVWKYRFVSKTLPDEDIKLPTTDRGLRLKGSMPFLTYEAMAVNGEGTGARNVSGNEVNKCKDYAARIAVSPFENGDWKGFKINFYAHQGYSDIDKARNRLFGGLSYESAKWNAMTNYYAADDNNVKGAGYSAHGSFAVTKDKEVFARCENWDKNTDVSDNAYSRIIGGISQQVISNIRLALSYQSIIQEKETPTQKNQNVVSANLGVKF